MKTTKRRQEILEAAASDMLVACKAFCADLEDTPPGLYLPLDLARAAIRKAEQA